MGCGVHAWNVAYQVESKMTESKVNSKREGVNDAPENKRHTIPYHTMPYHIIPYRDVTVDDDS